MADRIADPSPEEIRQECEAIQATWTPEEERWRRTNPHLEGDAPPAVPELEPVKAPWGMDTQESSLRREN